MFAFFAVVAVPLLFHQGRDQWFFLDEWGVMQRDVSLDGFLRPHNEHLVAFPALVYRVLFKFVGFNAYWPYQAVVIGFHVAAVTLLRQVMLRADVRPWIATACAVPLLVFGSGRQDVLWAFQMTFTGALALGLAHLLLADHPGRVGWRDAAGLAFGLVAVASSAVGVIMVGAVGLAMLVRRGWKVAALHVVPLAVVFLTWWWFRGRGAYEAPSGLRAALEFSADGVAHTFVRIGQVRGMGLILGLAVVAGLAEGVRRFGLVPMVRRAALPLAVAVAGVAFVAVTGFARAGRTGNDIPQATRYVYLIGVMTVPLLAVAVDRLADRSRLLGGLALLPLLVGIPGNVQALRPNTFEQFTLGREDFVLVAVHLPAMRQLPPDHQPFSLFEGGVTAGWLQSALAAGKFPEPPEASAQQRADMAFDLSITHGPALAPGDGCRPLTGEVEVVLERGQSLLFQGDALEVQLRAEGATSRSRRFRGEGPQAVRALAGPLDLVVRPAQGGAVELCAIRGGT